MSHRDGGRKKHFPENQEAQDYPNAANKKGHSVFPGLCFLICKMRTLDKLTCKSLPIRKPQDSVRKPWPVPIVHKTLYNAFPCYINIIFILNEIKLDAIEYALVLSVFCFPQNGSRLGESGHCYFLPLLVLCRNMHVWYYKRVP